MKKLSPVKRKLLQLIADAGGTYCPSIDLDPAIIRALRELVNEGRLSVEPNDGAPPRYSLTSLGAEEAV